MSGIFKPGQMVKLVEWAGEHVDLFNTPALGRTKASQPLPRVIGRLLQKDVALLIARERSDGSNVYVLGPHGGGWTYGALLTVVVNV